MSLNKQIITDRFIGCDSEYADSDIVLFGAGFDGTTSYRPGARFGGKVIRAESYGLETYSPYLDRDLTDLKVFDSGELELPFGNTQQTLGIIRNAVSEILNKSRTKSRTPAEVSKTDGVCCPVMLGGEHLVTLPAVEACLEKYPDLHIIHLDAHTDLREDYLGERLSHACVMRRCWELLGDNKIFSFGIRSGTREEFQWAEGKVSINRPVPKLGPKLGKRLPAYLTIDLDVLDPSEFPATGTPEAGGWRFDFLRSQILSFCRSFNIVGADLVEFSPPYDTNGVCAAAAGKVLRELLLSLRL